ncbi:MAG: FliM/FliN family flagellar motor switch protein [Erythrobacter sp.]
MSALNPAMHRFGDVTVRLSVELGRTEMALRNVLSLEQGSVVPLDRLTDELLDLTANGQVIARGEVVAQDGRFALRIVSLSGDENVNIPPPPPVENTPPQGAGFPSDVQVGENNPATTATPSSAPADGQADPPSAADPESPQS